MGAMMTHEASLHCLRRLHQRGVALVPQVGFDYPLRYGTVGADISRNSRDRAFGRTVNLALSVMSGDCPCILRALPPHAVSAAVGADPDRVICHGGRGWLTATDFQFLPAMNTLSHWSAPSGESQCTAAAAPSSRTGCRDGFGRRNPNIRPYARSCCTAATYRASAASGRSRGSMRLPHPAHFFAAGRFNQPQEHPIHSATVGS